jgi:hypothetical protein
MYDTCHNLIGADMALMVFVKKLDNSWVHGPICYFCIQYKALGTFIYYKELIANRCNHRH